MDAKSQTIKTGLFRMREEMNTLLLKCTEKEQSLFNRMYPSGPSDEQLDWACTQIERTLENRKDS